MKKHGHFVSGLLGGLIAVMLMAALPAVAGNGDNMIIGEKNTAKTVTRLNTRGGLRIDNFKAGNPALILQVQPGTAAIQLNTAAWIENMHADLLDGYQAHEMMRVAHAESANIDEVAVFGASAEAAVLTATIDAPTAGFLVINAQAYIGGNDRFMCRIYVDGTEVTGGRIYGMQNAGEGLCTSMGTQSIAAGTRTVAFNLGDRTDYTVDDAALSVIFIPFGATGAVGSP